MSRRRQSVILFREACQSWEHVVSDQIVYFNDVLDLQDDSRLLFAKLYERGDVWLEMLVWSGTHYVVAIICSFSAHRSKISRQGRQASPEYGSSGDINAGRHGNSSMLVDSVQFMKAPERIGTNWRSIRSIVWLNRFDIADCFVGEPLHLPVELSAILGGGGAEKMGNSLDSESTPVWLWIRDQTA